MFLLSPSSMHFMNSRGCLMGHIAGANCQQGEAHRCHSQIIDICSETLPLQYLYFHVFYKKVSYVALLSLLSLLLQIIIKDRIAV